MTDFSKVTPLHDKIIIRVIPRDDITTGGIIIPPTARDQTIAWKAEVLAVGPGKVLKDGTRQAPEIKPGDTVFVGKYMGSALEEEKVYVVEEEHLLGVVES